MKLKDILKDYCDQGFYLVPCYTNKRPLLKDYVNAASNNMEVIEAWARQFPNCNWAIMPSRSGHVVVDVDLKQNGMEFWQGLVANYGEPETMRARTGSGGLHYVFKVREGAKYKGKIKKDVGIDIRHKNYIVVYPSIHANGKRYKWEEKTKPIQMPKWLQDIFEKPISNSPLAPEAKLETGIEYFKKVAKEIKTKEFDYGTWVQLGMAIHAILPNDAGLELWKDISEGINYNDGDLELCDSKWEGFRDDTDGGVTERSFLYIARQLGCDIPNPLLEADKKAFAEMEKAERELEAEENPEWFTDPVSGKLCTVHKDFLVKWMNEQGHALMTVSNAGTIATFREDNQGIKHASTIQEKNFRTLYGDRFYKFYEGQEGKKPKFRPAVNVWLESSEKTSYSKIVFAPTAEEGELNLWSELPCIPEKGNVDGFVKLCTDVLANGDKAKAEWLIQWSAHIMQKPAEKCTLVPVFIGDQGTGKGLFSEGILASILGPFFYKIATAATLKEKFNEEQGKKFLTFIDEASWRGDKTEDGIMKSLTGSAQMTVEEKFGARYRINNYSRYLIASNNPDAVSIERSNRRYVVFEVNPKNANNDKFFAPLWNGLRKGVLGPAVYDYLLRVDISKFNPYKLPHFDNQGLTAKVNSEGVVAQFWVDLFFHNPRELFFEGETLIKEWTYEAFKEFASESKTWEKGISRMLFWSKTAKLFGANWSSDSRVSVNGGTVRGLKMGAFEAMTRLSESLKIDPPKDFDDFEFFYESEFKEI